MSQVALLQAKEECASMKKKCVDTFDESTRMSDEEMDTLEKELNICFPDGMRTYLKTLGPGKSSLKDKRQLVDWKAEYAVKQVKRIYENLKKSLVQSISEYNVWKPEWDYIREEYKSEKKLAAGLQDVNLQKKKEAKVADEDGGEKVDETPFRELEQEDKDALAELVWKKAGKLIPVTSRHFCISSQDFNRLYSRRMDITLVLRHLLPNNVCEKIVQLLDYQKPKEGIFSMAVSSAFPYDVQDVITYADGIPNFLRVRSGVIMINQAVRDTTHEEMYSLPIWGTFFIR